ncbi:hypothetical protein [Nonomuraea sp. NPDC050691]|uniref:hypothetical protein n=1 Tax=Nonomuraea sp. NPDC050691 TaxID=3155661 RepID=UPI003400963B
MSDVVPGHPFRNPSAPEPPPEWTDVRRVLSGPAAEPAPREVVPVGGLREVPVRW